MDPKYFAYESRYSVLKNNPNCFIDPNGDFANRISAWIYMKTHKGANKIGYDKNKKEYFTYESTTTKSIDGEVGISLKYNNKKYSWNVKVVAIAEVAGSIGVQGEVKWKTPEAWKTKLEGKIGGGAAVFEMGKLKIGFDGDEFVAKPESANQVIHNYGMFELGGTINGRKVGGGGKVDYNFAYYNGFYGPRQDGEANLDYGGYFFGKSFNKGGKKYDDIFNPFSNPLTPKLKTGSKAEGEDVFHGIEFGGSTKLILGVEYKLKIGLVY